MSVVDIVGGIRAISRRGGRLVAVTVDSPTGGGEPLGAFLRRMREAFGVDAVFVSEFVQGRRVIREVDCDPGDDEAVLLGASDPLEESYCFHVAEGRLPPLITDTGKHPLALSLPGTRAARVGSHLAVPILGRDGRAFGTVCCLSHAPDEGLGSEEQMITLQTIAALLGDTFCPGGAG